MKITIKSTIVIIFILFGCLGLINAEPLGTVFTYEGYFLDFNQPAEGLYDLELTLYDDPDPNYGVQIGYINEADDCNVIDGSFIVDVDFSLGDPNVFDGQKRWLEIGYRNGELKDPNEYTLVKPRQEILAVPYALYSASGTPGPQGEKGDTGDMGPQGPSGDSHWQRNGSDTYYVEGNVGIGTISPAAKLEVEGKLKVTGESSKYDSIIYCKNTGYGEAIRAESSSNTGVYGYSNTGTGVYGNTSSGYAGYFSGNCYFSGNIGIGTSSPQTMLDVDGAINISNPGDGNVLLNLSLERSWQFRQYGSGLHSALELTSMNGTGNKNFVINTTGYVGIGIKDPAYKLDVDGIIHGNNISAVSDARLKKDIKTIDNALEKIISLRGINFKWIDEKYGSKSQVGVIAQEVEEVFPEAVLTDEQGYKSVTYGGLVAPLIEAIKEQQIQIELLQKENEILKEKMEAIEKKLN